MSCVGMSVELQLVWLFEICVLLCYLYGRNTTRNKITTSNDDADIDIDIAYAKYLGVYAPERLLINRGAYTRLYLFRNAFVHKGYLEDQVLLQEFFEAVSSEELDALQTVTGVTLNMRNTLM